MSLHRNRTSPGRRIAGLLAVLMALPHAAPASAYSVTIGTGTRAIYLRVGDGSLSGGATYNSGGTPAANPTINLVSVTVPAAVVGNTTNQAMTGTGRVSSDLDGFAFCNAGQTYIGGFYRTPDNAAATAALRYTAPANLTTAGGDTIPISQLTWTSPRGGLYMFISAKGLAHSMTRRTLDRLLGNDVLRIVSRGGVVERALDAVAQQALRNTQGGDAAAGTPATPSGDN